MFRQQYHSLWTGTDNNHIVPGLNNKMYVLELPNQGPGASGETLSINYSTIPLLLAKPGRF